MPKMNDKPMPSFVREYRTEGACLWVHSGTGIGEIIAREFLRKRFPDANLNLMMYAGFWILEGVLYAHELSGEVYESLNHYLSERQNMSIEERWALYCVTIDDATTGGILHDAYNNTRRHVMETMAELPLEDKKKSSKPASTNS